MAVVGSRCIYARASTVDHGINIDPISPSVLQGPLQFHFSFRVVELIEK